MECLSWRLADFICDFLRFLPPIFPSKKNSCTRALFTILISIHKTCVCVCSLEILLDIFFVIKYIDDATKKSILHMGEMPMELNAFECLPAIDEQSLYLYHNFPYSIYSILLWSKFVVLSFIKLSKSKNIMTKLYLQFLHLHFLIKVSSLMSSWQALQ